MTSAQDVKVQVRNALATVGTIIHHQPEPGGDNAGLPRNLVRNLHEPACQTNVVWTECRKAGDVANRDEKDMDGCLW